jgi:hypothetical protein
MEVKNSHVAGTTPAGATGRGLATEPAPISRIVVRKRGRGVNSKKPERRWLYLHVEPFDFSDLETGIQKAVDAINKLLDVWEPPVRRGFLRPDMWWDHAPCHYCQRRMEYEVKMWQAYMYVWRRNMCLRHWFVHHLSMIVPSEPEHLISNRPISITASDRLIQFDIETVNYRYRVWLNKERAEMEVEYKGKTYRYSFRNHMRGYPFLSSYMNIVIDVVTTLELFRDFLTDYVPKRKVNANVVVNDAFTIPPPSPDADNCATCRL